MAFGHIGFDVCHPPQDEEIEHHQCQHHQTTGNSLGVSPKPPDADQRGEPADIVVAFDDFLEDGADAPQVALERRQIPALRPETASGNVANGNPADKPFALNGSDEVLLGRLAECFGPWSYS